MKILAITDIHSEDNENLYNYIVRNNIKLILIAGDITNFGPLEFVDDFFKKLIELNCDIIAIPGNCDPKGVCNKINNVGGVCLHNDVIAYGNVMIAGYGGSNPTPFDTPGEIEDNQIKEDINKLLSDNNFKDTENLKILLTHAPPYNTNADLIEGGVHVGSQGVYDNIIKFQPDINICGHIHEAKTCEKLDNNTIVSNPGMLNDNGAVLISVNDSSDYTIELVDLSQ